MPEPQTSQDASQHEVKTISWKTFVDVSRLIADDFQLYVGGQLRGDLGPDLPLPIRLLRRYLRPTDGGFPDLQLANHSAARLTGLL